MSVSLSPLGGAGWQFFDSNGNPLAGGLLYTYSAGTTSLVATYTDHTGGTPNSNPIVLTSSGTVPNEIWLTGGSAYKFVLQNSLAVQQGAWDYVSGINDVTSIFASPALTGTPTAPTAIASTNNTQIATTAFANTAANNVKGELAGETLFNATATLTLAELGQQIKFYGSTASQVLTLVSRVTSAVGQGNWFVNIASVPVTLQTYTGDNIYSNVAGTGSSTATAMILAPGDSTYLVNDGTYWQEQQGVRGAAIAQASSQIQSVGASIASSALTVTYSGGTLSFRSPTLTTGAPISPMAVGAQSLVIPSGATLGTVSGQQSQLILLELYNAGSPILAVTNAAGGVNLDETTLLSTQLIASSASYVASIAVTGVMTVTSIASGALAVGQPVVGTGVPLGAYITSFGTGAGGTGTYNTTCLAVVASETMASTAVSASVVYAASAVTSSPFRVIGEVVSTQATAGTWATAPTLVQGAGGQAILGLAFPSSLATNGYQKLSSGLIIQWGTASVAGSSSGTVTLPVTFPHAGLALFVGGSGTGTGNGATCVYGAFINASSFTLVSQAYSAVLFSNEFWLAIGY